MTPELEWPHMLKTVAFSMYDYGLCIILYAIHVIPISSSLMWRNSTSDPRHIGDMEYFRLFQTCCRGFHHCSYQV